jgi:predicted DNA-binding transcriptional regulator YafY
LPKNRRAEIDRPQIYAPLFNAHRAIDKLIETARAAIDDRAVLELTYLDERGRETQRAVRPLALNFWGSAWTLAAWCGLRNDFRNFRLDRVRAGARTGALFVDEPGKTLGDYLRSVGAD